MYSFRFKSRVRYQETDRMGIVYHANYIIWFDMGRTELLRSLGYTYRDLEEDGIWLPVIEIGCKYKHPSRYDDEVVIEAFIEEMTKVKIKFGYRIYKDDELLVEGFSTHAFTNPYLKPVALNKIKPELYDTLKKCI